MNESVTLMEVSPRDGLQNESTLLSTQDKLRLIDYALDAGCTRIEVARGRLRKKSLGGASCTRRGYRKWPMPRRSARACRNVLT